jgi:hypothetical protein
VMRATLFSRSLLMITPGRRLNAANFISKCLRNAQDLDAGDGKKSASAKRLKRKALKRACQLPSRGIFVFLSLEDETGISNVIVNQDLY